MEVMSRAPLDLAQNRLTIMLPRGQDIRDVSFTKEQQAAAATKRRVQPSHRPHTPDHKLARQLFTLKTVSPASTLSQRGDDSRPELSDAQARSRAHSRKSSTDQSREACWQDTEIPSELEVVRADIPEEIRNIIQESIDEHRAMRASRIAQPQAIVVRTTITQSRSSEKDGRRSPLTASSASAWSGRAGSSVSGDMSSVRSIGIESTTSLDSSEGGNDLWKPPITYSDGSSRGFEESLGTEARSRVILPTYSDKSLPGCSVEGPEHVAQCGEIQANSVAEEARHFAVTEYERLDGITEFFERLRDTLEKVRSHQKQAIEQRHSDELQNVEEREAALVCGEKTLERDQKVATQRAELVEKNQDRLKDLRKSHALQLMETVRRHRNDQDTFLAKYNQASDPVYNGHVDQAGVLELLLKAQDVERTTLRSQQNREIRKWEKRGHRLLEEFDSKTEAERLEIVEAQVKEAEEVTQMATMVKRQISADWKWFNAIFLDRAMMLGEDERRMILSGAHAPRPPDSADCT